VGNECYCESCVKVKKSNYARVNSRGGQRKA
jgi:hypothetical protein